MALIPQHFIQDLIARIDIVDIIQARIKLTKRNQNYLACCPFHNEKTPSFSVNQKKQFYYCFGCSASGNVIGFLMNYDRMEFVEAVEYLAAHIGIEVPHENNTEYKSHDELYTTLEHVARYYQQQLRQTPEGINYLKSRGLSGLTAKQFGLGFAPNNWDNLLQYFNFDPAIKNQLITSGMLIAKDQRVYDRFRKRVMFPILNIRGRVIGFGGRSIDNQEPKYLNSPETPVFHKSQELYGLFEARKQKKLERLLIVEGYMDVISLAQHDIHYAVATLGTATNIKHLQKILRYCQTVIFCFDGDRAGRDAAWKAVTISLPLLRDGIHIRFLFLPQDEDPDSLIRQIGKDAFEQQLEGAHSLPDVFYQHLQNEKSLSSLEDRAHFARDVSELLNTMPNGIYQQLMYQRLAQMLNMNIDELDRLRQLPPKTETSPYKPTQHLTITQLAIAMLVQHPHLIEYINDLNMHYYNHSAEGNLLLTLIQKLKQSPSQNTGQLLAQFEGNPFQSLLLALAGHELHIPEDLLTEEFLNLQQRIFTQTITKKIDQLIEKSKNSELTSTEKQQLSKLLTAKQNLPM